MLELWLRDLESLEAITQDDGTRDLVLRMAELSKTGNLAPFLFELDCDQDLDAATKATFAELARDEVFLHAVEDYVHRTRDLH
ncbi:MAG: hypothetical protein JO186_04840 [Actinobacteria bacterium]|nr:hypothetical protein [Actinomycetota bacterium]MBV8598124.1 hypothetical protein [Actinomycetota bacterium]